MQFDTRTGQTEAHLNEIDQQAKAVKHRTRTPTHL